MLISLKSNFHIRVILSPETDSAWLVCYGDKESNNRNSNRVDDPRNVNLFCDLMAVDEEEEEEEEENGDNKKERGGFKVEDIEDLGSYNKWRMHLPFKKIDGTEIIMNVHAGDKWLVDRIRTIVNGKKVTVKCIDYVTNAFTLSLCCFVCCSLSLSLSLYHLQPARPSTKSSPKFKLRCKLC